MSGEILDPEPKFDEQLAAELTLLREELANAAGWKERRRVKRAIRRLHARARRAIRSDVLSSPYMKRFGPVRHTTGGPPWRTP